MGQQGNDTLCGGEGEDDRWGGHNVRWGEYGNDVIFGDADVIAGDNGDINRTLGTGTKWNDLIRCSIPFKAIHAFLRSVFSLYVALENSHI